MSESELLKFHFALKKLKKKEPIQYILEEAPFYGLNFYVSPNVLIPRPETEELVHLILENIRDDASVLEVGTGSGCIPVALASKKSKLKITAVDVRVEVLEIAEKNAKLNNVEVQFLKQDILEVSDLKKTFEVVFDVVISNPPYIGESEKKEMSESVLDFEPSIALFVADDDPLLFYRKITELSYVHFSRGGQLFFEINQKYGKEVVVLMKEIGFEAVSLVKDINGNDRMVHGVK